VQQRPVQHRPVCIESAVSGTLPCTACGTMVTTVECGQDVHRRPPGDVQVLRLCRTLPCAGSLLGAEDV
jgi:hypothetical protein